MTDDAVKLDPDATYFKATLAKLFDVSERCIEKWVARGRFPRPFKLGARDAWIGRTIIAWQDRQQAKALEGR
jgi:predicted DNA-binding transcriptional regulator AlpA